MSPIASYTHFADGYCVSVELEEREVTLFEADSSPDTDGMAGIAAVPLLTTEVPPTVTSVTGTEG